jgi:hypothetical protein
VLAVLVAVSMLLTSGSAGVQHVHAYTDHDHAEHHHGPASHAHAAVTPHPDSDSHAPDAAARLEGGDPGEHAVSVAVTYVAPQPDQALVPVTLDTTVATPPERVWRHVVPSDVRAHSPPRLTDAPLRAPPVVHLV